MDLILGLDLGRCSAWCHGAPGEAPTSGHVDTSLSGLKGAPKTSMEAYARLHGAAMTLMASIPRPSVVYLEAPYGHLPGARKEGGHQHGGAWSAQVVARCLQVWVCACLEVGVPWEAIHDKETARGWQRHIRLGRGVKRSREALGAAARVEAEALGGIWGKLVKGEHSQDEVSARQIWLRGCGQWKAERMRGRVMELVRR